MKYVLLLAISSVLMANLDMVMGDLDQDELVLSWVMNDTSLIAKYYDDEFHNQFLQPGHTQVALGLASDPSGGKHVSYYFVETYNQASEIQIFAYDDLSLESEESIYTSLDGDTVAIGCMKSPSEEWDMVFGGGALQVTSTMTFIVATLMAYDVNEDGSVDYQWHATQQVQFYKGDPYSRSEYPGQIAGPIACPGGYPLMVTSFGVDGNYYRTYAYSLDPDSTELPYYEFDYTSCTPEYSGVMAIGSSSDTEAILLYSDDIGEVEMYEFGPFSPVPSYPSFFPWDSPDHDDPVAMTSTYEMPGFLMVWHSDGEIRCRHWLNGWNGYDHIIDPSAGDVSEGNIAVVSDTDGYWVAWRQDGYLEPEVVFVPYGDVTGIEEGPDPPEGVGLVPLSNPSSGSISLVISGIQSGTLSVYDMGGRLVMTEEVAGEGIHQIDGDFASGMYLARLEYDNGVAECSVVVLQ